MSRCPTAPTAATLDNVPVPPELRATPVDVRVVVTTTGESPPRLGFDLRCPDLAERTPHIDVCRTVVRRPCSPGPATAAVDPHDPPGYPRPRRARAPRCCDRSPVAALEWIAAASAYRSTPRWPTRSGRPPPPRPSPPSRRRARLLGTPPGSAPARAPAARPALRAWTSIAAPDLHGVPRFHVLGHAGSPHAGAWSSELTEPTSASSRPRCSPPATTSARSSSTTTSSPPPPLLTDWLADPAAPSATPAAPVVTPATPGRASRAASPSPPARSATARAAA
jgi:hypothetical protein